MSFPDTNDKLAAMDAADKNYNKTRRDVLTRLGEYDTLCRNLEAQVRQEQDSRIAQEEIIRQLTAEQAALRDQIIALTSERNSLKTLVDSVEELPATRAKRIAEIETRMAADAERLAKLRAKESPAVVAPK